MADSRLAILNHEQFEELCVLAAAGEIEPAELARVRVHLYECESCRVLVAEIGDLLAIQLSPIASLRTGSHCERELRIKNSILVAASKEKEKEEQSVQSSQPIRGVLKARAAGASNS
jgi:anti-sigma factor ChrR (cupin superfamily)